VVSRIDDFCPKCGKSAFDALEVPLGPDNHAYACRNCDGVWGSVDDWAAIEEYAHLAPPDQDASTE
jgi:hypothetical protein